MRMERFPNSVTQTANLQAWAHTLCPVSPPHPKTWSQLPTFHGKLQTKENIPVIMPYKLI